MDLSLSRRREISTFAGEATYRARFRVDEDRYDVVDLGTVHGTSEVKLNGRSLGVRWWGAHRYDVAGLLRKGWNRLEVTVTVVAANYARSRRNNKAAQVWSSWYPPIPTGLMGPVRLVRTYRTRQTAR